MSSDLFTVAGSARAQQKVKGSKFIALAYSVETVDEFKLRLGSLRNEYRDASHICYAYRLFSGFTIFEGPNTSEYQSDDGEPRGSAGLPILNILKRNLMINSVVFVIRYFGGHKLGIPGLIDAYGSSAQSALQDSDKVRWTATRTLRLRYVFVIESQMRSIFKKYGVSIVEQKYTDDIEAEIKVEEQHFDSFNAELSEFRKKGLIS